MANAAALVLITVGLAYLGATIVLSRRKRGVLAAGEGAEPSHFVFVVPALDEEAVIATTVERLLLSCGTRGRVVVVNDGSSDRTGAILDGIHDKRLTVHTRTSPQARLGKGAALNDVFQSIRDDVLARGIDPHAVVLGIVDADGRLQNDVLAHVAPFFRDPVVGALQLLVRIRNRFHRLGRFQDYEFLVFASLTQTAREHLGSVGLGGNGQFTRLAALMELGDEPWTDCLTEDLDLGVRLAIAGWQNRFCDTTHVNQQGLTSIPQLLRQRTRWAQGHLQCWKLIPAIIRSQLPTVTVLDLCYYLLAPAIVLASSALFTATMLLFAVQFALDPRSFTTGRGLQLAAFVYVMSFGPALYLSLVYRKRATAVFLREAFAMAHLLALYNYIWYVAEWKAVFRIISGRTGWSKTQRLTEGHVTLAPMAARTVPLQPAELPTSPAMIPKVSTDMPASQSNQPIRSDQPIRPSEPDTIIDLDEAAAEAPQTSRLVMVCFGTRPEAIKMVPVIRALQAHPALHPMVVLTGQHPEMVDEVLSTFRIRPDVDLGLHSPGQTLDVLTSRALSGIGTMLRDARPAAVVVQGDTATTFAAALAAFYERIPVVHVEAGLRTGDMDQPFPEEANRRLTTTLTALHLAATESNRVSLLREQVEDHKIAVVGNPVIDSLRLACRSVTDEWDAPVYRDLFAGPAGTDGGPLVLVTAHRRESWGTPLVEVARALADVARARPDARFVWPLHPNPAVRGWVAPIVSALPNVTITGPAGYRDFVRLLRKASVVVTDSGGVQEEAPALGLPVLVTRDVTERQEAVDCGAATLVGTNRERVAFHLLRTLDEVGADGPSTVPSPFGDGLAGQRVAAAIAELLGVGSRLPDFDGQRDHALAI